MMSCGGTSSTTVRNETRTNRSIAGQMYVSPGPLGLVFSRPSVKTTPRSYSLKILMPEMMNRTMNSTGTTNVSPGMFSNATSSAIAQLDFQRHVPHRLDPHPASSRDRRARRRVPVLAMNEDLSFGADVGHGLTHLAGECLHSRHHPRALRAHRHRGDRG